MTASTIDRVPRNTDGEVNARIRQEIEVRVRFYAGNPAGISRRLRQLDEEWDIERLLQTNASALAFLGTVLGMTSARRWFALPFFVSAFLFQHSVQGWCPPIPVLRRLGYRTPREIETERVALKALRGDFGPLTDAGDDADARARAALLAARL
jgi:hypothetical protein